MRTPFLRTETPSFWPRHPAERILCEFCLLEVRISVWISQVRCSLSWKVQMIMKNPWQNSQQNPQPNSHGRVGGNIHRFLLQSAVCNSFKGNPGLGPYRWSGDCLWLRKNGQEEPRLLDLRRLGSSRWMKITVNPERHSLGCGFAPPSCP